MKIRITDFKGNEWVGELGDAIIKNASGWEGPNGEFVISARDVEKTYHYSNIYSSLFIQCKPWNTA